MYTNIEFLDAEPIENMITCMHHKMDKVIFFGYADAIRKYQKRTTDFLKNHCDVAEIEFCSISEQDLNAVISAIKEKVASEEAMGNKVYFDITGGESLFLVAFGMLSQVFKKPMHMYDVAEDSLIHLGEVYEDNIQRVPANNVQLDLHTYIELSGAKIDENRPSYVNVEDEAFMAKVEDLWAIVLRFKQNWNQFCAVLRDHLNEEKCLDATKVITQKECKNFESFHKYMIALKNLGAFTSYNSRILTRNDNNRISSVEVSVVYTDEAWKECITKAGTALELYVYKNLKDAGKETLQSVHIDWDGKISVPPSDNEKDVLNEIDVLMLEGNIPTFISCKCGKMDKGKALEPMYELETVASRFGGKYAKKILATLNEVKGSYALRADEMNIKLDCYG